MNDSRLVSTKTLAESDRLAMYSLLSNHFEGVTSEVFEADLQQKNWVVLMEKNGILKGFSTLLFYRSEFAGEVISVVYSGDTIVDPSAWSSSTLSKAWIAAVKKLRRDAGLDRPGGKLYWLLISSGYRTYRFLPTFWREFYPRFDRQTPETTKALMEFLGGDRFGECYNKETGIVRFDRPQSLRGQLKGIPPERLKDPHVSFFNAKNQGHLVGDELLCLAEIAEENLTPAGRRMWFANVRSNRFSDSY
ncbi:MAG: hypothetical protein SXA11_22190 [Cyanobacteriota bacterium]|nr:hypothetical protein [Cyanobacteriota bacterium]